MKEFRMVAILSTRMRLPVNWPYVVYFGIALSGFVVQVYHVSDEYFQYDTVTQLTIIRPIWTTPPALIFCFIFKQIANKGIATKYGLNSSDPDILDKVTVEQLFNMTPPLNNLIESCKFKSKGYSLDTLNGTDCADRLVIKKFSKQRSVCYSFVLKDRRPYFLNYLTNSIDGAKFYQLRLNSGGFNGTDYYLVYVHNHRLNFHGRSDSYLEHFRTINKTTGIGENSFVTVSYSRYTSRLLPKPYDTNCLNYSKFGYESSDDCFERCVNKSAQEVLGKVPFSIANDRPSSSYILTDTDLKNSSQVKNLDNLEKKCRRECSQPDCVIEDFTPKVICSENYAGVAFELYAPNEPDVITEFKPKSSMVDYCTMILSCIGFWFGFSPLYFMIDSDILTMLINRRAWRLKKRPKKRLVHGGATQSNSIRRKPVTSPMEVRREPFRPDDRLAVLLRPKAIYSYLPVWRNI